MSSPARRRAPAWSRAIAIVGGGYTLLGGLVTLLGWGLDIQQLTDWHANGISMMPNAALAAVGAGTAVMLLALGYRRVAAGLGGFLCLLGGATLFEYVAAVDLGIDRLLVYREWGQRAAAVPGRMGVPGATSWTVIGITVVLLASSQRTRAWAAWGGVVVIGIAMLSLLGYMFDADTLYTLPLLTTIALQTSTMIMAVGTGLIAAVPEHGIVGLLRRDDAGGVLARRLLAPVVLLPILLGWLRLQGQRAGIYDTAFGTAARTLLEIALLLGFVCWAARSLSRADAVRRSDQAALRAADQRKDEFLATLAHELRNPLAPVRNALEVLKLAGHDPGSVADVRTMMERQVAHMTRLIDDLTDVSRITRGKVTLRRQVVDLAAVIRESADLGRAMFAAKNQSLQLTLPAGPLLVDGDPVRLGQIVGNLLNNACKYTDRGGTVDVCGERVSATVILSVRDNGIGLAPDMLGRVFDMFAQVDQSLERAEGGLGIGLSLVKGLVGLHGGSVIARSDGPGRGSEFVVRLPAMAVAPAPVAESAGKPGVAAAPRS